MTRDDKILSLVPVVLAVAREIHVSLPGNVAAREDLIAWGWVGAIQAVNRWDPRRPVPLRLFARHRVRGAMLDYLRSLDLLSRKGRAAYSKQFEDYEITGSAAPIPIFEVGLDEIISHTTADAPTAEEIVRRVHLAQIMARAELTVRETALIELHFFQSKKLVAIGRGFGVGQARASQIKKRALEKLRAVA